MTRLRLCGIVFVAVLGSAIPVHTHSLANTIVSVRMTRQQTVDVTIAAEADPLIAKLEALGGTAASVAPATSAERRARLESLVPTLRAHIDARIAGEPVSFELRSVDVDDTAQTSIHLTAPMPPGSATFTWGCTFIFGAYQFANGTVEDIQWLQGPQTSRPITLAPPRAEGPSYAPWLTRIGHSLAMGLLVVYIIGRRAIAVSGCRWGQRRRLANGTPRDLYDSERPNKTILWSGLPRGGTNVSTRCRTISPGTSLPFSSTKPPRSLIYRG